MLEIIKMVLHIVVIVVYSSGNITGHLLVKCVINSQPFLSFHVVFFIDYVK